MFTRNRRITLLTAGLIFSAVPVMAGEDGRPTATGSLFAPPIKTDVSKRKAAAKKPKAKKKAAVAVAPPLPPEPFDPRVFFAVSTPNDWYLQLGTPLGTVDLFRNLRINGTVWVHHDKHEIRQSFHMTDIAAVHDIALRSGREVSDIEPLCDDDSAVAFSHWKTETDTVRVAYRTAKLDGETVTLVFQGQWPAWSNAVGANDFDKMVCGGWVWWEKPL